MLTSFCVTATMFKFELFHAVYDKCTYWSGQCYWHHSTIYPLHCPVQKTAQPYTNKFEHESFATLSRIILILFFPRPSSCQIALYGVPWQFYSPKVTFMITCKIQMVLKWRGWSCLKKRKPERKRTYYLPRQKRWAHNWKKAFWPALDHHDSQT